MTRVHRLWPLALVVLSSATYAQKAYKPTTLELVDSFKRGNELEREARASAFKLQLTPNWIEGGVGFWYRNNLAGGRKEFWLVDTGSGKKSPAFDAKKLADSLKKATEKHVDADRLPFDEIGFGASRKILKFAVEGKRWDCDLTTYELKPGEGDVGPSAGPGSRRGGRDGGNGFQAAPSRRTSPDGKWTAEIREGKLKVASSGGPTAEYEAKIDNVAGIQWTPDSSRLIAFRRIQGDHKLVHLIRSSSPNSTRGELMSRPYDQPGDVLDTFETFLVDPSAKSESQTELPTLATGGQPWSNPPGIDWLPGGKEFIVDYPERGYGRYFVDAIDATTGKRRSVIDEDPATFFDTTAMIFRILEKTPEMIWRSERDGFGRLYLIDAASGAVKNPITPTHWVVRSVEWVDEGERKLCFSANCVDPLLDPYFIHFFTVKFDGSGLIRLTDGPGTHRVQFSPDRKTVLDTWSRVDSAPVHELRRVADGAKLATLESGDISEWKKLKVPLPEVFVAKGRDGKTDIWGVVIRPTHLDAKKSYPIIENIYAGPQDSFTPKAFSPFLNMQKLAELGFVVVQVDGMGTRNRGKAFHDICYKNIADAGFPDRILWMKALAKKYPYVDIDRVGVYGTSAGGQNSAGAVLFHPEFYKVAVSSCGCHDNRIDKQWWNEQWMGVMGPHYAEQSNITNAAKLQGNLMLMVGELDTNVPPESTYRFADALIKARKEFELVVITGADHTGGGPYGDRKRMDFFVRHLLGVQTPDWNKS